MTGTDADPRDGACPAMRRERAGAGRAQRSPRRHDRVWLAADWRVHASADPADARLDAWIAAGRALVTRRRDRSVPDGSIALGIALPLVEGRARIAVVVDRRAIVRSAPPLALADLIEHAPETRRAALGRLVVRGAAIDTTFSVYGSYAWQAMSGEACVNARSDLDLLWVARDAAHVARVVALLLAWEREFDLRADGEARFADGADIAWRELAGHAARVLVKRDDRVALEPSPVLR